MELAVDQKIESMIFPESPNCQEELIYEEIRNKYFVPKDKQPDEVYEVSPEIKKIIDPNNTLEIYNYRDIFFTEDINDPDYMKNKVTYKQYKQKEKHYNEAWDIYGEDTDFNNIFGFFAPELSIQFMDIKDIIRVVLETSEKNIVKYTKRNPRHGVIYRKIQEKCRMIEKLNKSLKK
jgi:hypothetical protein